MMDFGDGAVSLNGVNIGKMSSAPEMDFSPLPPISPFNIPMLKSLNIPIKNLNLPGLKMALGIENPRKTIASKFTFKNSEGHTIILEGEIEILETRNPIHKSWRQARRMRRLKRRRIEARRRQSARRIKSQRWIGMRCSYQPCQPCLSHHLAHQYFYKVTLLSSIQSPTLEPIPKSIQS